MKNLHPIGIQIRKHLKARKLTVVQFAQDIGVSSLGSFSNREREESKVTGIRLVGLWVGMIVVCTAVWYLIAKALGTF